MIESIIRDCRSEAEREKNRSDSNNCKNRVGIRNKIYDRNELSFDDAGRSLRCVHHIFMLN